MKKHIFNDNKLVIASHNEGKVEEIKIMLRPLQIEVLSANDFNLKEPIEDGNNNRENLYYNLSENPEAKYMFIISTRDIEPGEELVADYTLYSFN